ncbi:hypothetical protein HPP92_018091 [Vanilla planifolia]|uniref:ADF-H domain-containing protein n=1 Tax=Vanilla planifolia TaxID=51239 RepID=A0A835QCB2_VANPL|nr:hypothetical protein HPP92_018091 [Vanilla planifolia]
MSNASSGMGVANHCRDTFLELQRKKAYRYVIFKIDEKQKEVVVEKTGGSTKAMMISWLPTGERLSICFANHCRDTFLELQRKKAYRYVIFKIDEKQKEVVVEKTGGSTESYDDFMASLPEKDCRYAVYDFDFVTEENCQKSKIFFIAWSPSVSRIRAKMLYATSKERFRREMDGVHYEIQATDPTELDIEILRDRAH